MPHGTAQKYISNIIKTQKWSPPVIDLGAGPFRDWYKPYFNTNDYFTLDIEQTPTKSINIIADIHNMPMVQSNHYGCVLLMETLEHLSNPFNAFTEIARILKPDGLFICTTVACWNRHDHPKDFWRFLPDGLHYLCDFAKLKVINITLDPQNTQSPSHCMCAARK